jgi:hypothetical protein
MPRQDSFIYIVEIAGDKKIVRSTSPGRAIKTAIGHTIVHRATANEVADLMLKGIQLIDGHNPEVAANQPIPTNGGKRHARN